MGYAYSAKAIDKALSELSGDYAIFAPKLFPDGAPFSGLDLVRYSKVSFIEEIVFDEKSANSPKEAFSALSQTLFYFTEDAVTEASPAKKAIVFLRACDINALNGLDDIFLRNREPDYFYDRVRKNTRLALIPCKDAFENCFCVDMGANKTDAWDICVQKTGDQYFVSCNADDLKQIFARHSEAEKDIEVPFPKETAVRVTVSQKIDGPLATKLPLWEEYDIRCINCGRCTFNCPSCACWSMQDMFYSENGRVGERRRVWSSCMVDGFSDMAGGESYRKKNGERMRYKTLHKVYDHKKRFGRYTCTGCGRCDDVCPEYISFANVINKVSAAFENGHL